MARIVSIVGLGLLGGSLGMALRQAGYEVVGWDRDAEVMALALERGAIDRAAETLMDAGRASGYLVIVATPVMAIKAVFEAIAPHLAPGTVVSDLASTKRQAAAWARDALRPDTPFVGGHPMAGLEVAGVANARAELFEGAVYCLTIEPGTPQDAVDRLMQLVEAVRARPLVVAPDVHDHLVASISHLPLLASAALVHVTTSDAEWEAMGVLAATGYRDATRLASGDPVMQRDICVTNADEIRPQLLALAEALKQAAGLLDDPEAIGAWLQEAKAARDAWLGAAAKIRQAGRS